jgi:hypothetical protein
MRMSSASGARPVADRTIITLRSGRLWRLQRLYRLLSLPWPQFSPGLPPLSARLLLLEELRHHGAFGGWDKPRLTNMTLEQLDRFEGGLLSALERRAGCLDEHDLAERNSANTPNYPQGTE